METHIVIMAGGIGSRFWPMSTPECPKQFIDVTGCGKSLTGWGIPDNIWIVTSDKYKETVRKQLPSVPPHHILTEPVARNTAPCITYACWKIKKHHPHANIVVTPADALVINTDEFRRVIAKALLMTDQSKEKPDLKTARHYVDAGNYFWNAGIFVWNVKTIEEAIRRYAPGIAEVFDRIYPEFYTEERKKP